ncbi:septal ring lytic transglycosylase RlpA family protein [Pseudodesulfovibrio sp.]|nr:septal ring lytic transglycosylase RlpA family protein [Pseudodesulfovibrio sp.]
MRHIIVLIVTLAVLGMAGCSKRIYSTPPSSSTKPVSLPKNYDPKTNPYTVMGKRYYPLKSAAGYDEVGKASWYGKDFHGKKTANGYIYNMYGVSAAHKTLPLGTQVRVTNLENNRSVVLTINDRGPFVHGRILDLSYGAAKALGSVERGVVKVRITAIGTIPVRAASKTASPVTTPKYFHVRVGAFADRENAERTHRRLVASGFEGAKITTVNRDGRTLHIVQAGSFISREKAERVLENLKDDFPSCYIIS